MKRVIQLLLGLLACGTFLLSAYKLMDYYCESQESRALMESLAEEAVVRRENEIPVLETEPPETRTPEETAPIEIQLPSETAPIEVNFDVLLDTNQDIVGWLYCEDTPINLPVVQSTDNDYYLRRMIDGTWNSAGTLFVDYRNAGDFSDNNTIIYGHNMQNDSMFGTLTKYKVQSYYDEHPVLWLLTPETDYKIELVAGRVVGIDSDVFYLPQTEQGLQMLVEQFVAESTFTTQIELSDNDRYLTLSTCSYEFNNARYVLIGRLIPLN